MTANPTGKEVMQAGLVDRLLDLHKQETVERSHYYTDSLLQEAIAEIVNNRELIGELVGALRVVEFNLNEKCPACFGWDMSPSGETPRAHTKDCPLARVLAKSQSHTAIGGE